MKKEKGFTLIELLAVIVILAVIALIATPLVMNMINDTTSSTGAQELVAKANTADVTVYSDGNTGEMYTFTHGSTIDYRYIGSTPNNYITFNNETWRIIGVFDGKMKIVRDDYIGEIDYANGEGTGLLAWNENGYNNWSTASLKSLLNDNTSDVWKLNSTALTQVVDSTWYLGDPLSASDYEADFDSVEEWKNFCLKTLTAEHSYTNERSTYVYEGNPTTWTGKVALMYPSDYLYTYAYGVDEVCSSMGLCGYDSETGLTSNPTASWLFKNNSAFAESIGLTVVKLDEWLLSPRADSSVTASHLWDDGYVYYSINVSGIRGGEHYPIGVRPVVYLKSDISLSGTGTASDPYTIN